MSQKVYQIIAACQAKSARNLLLVAQIQHFFVSRIAWYIPSILKLHGAFIFHYAHVVYGVQYSVATVKYCW